MSHFGSDFHKYSIHSNSLQSSTHLETDFILANMKLFILTQMIQYVKISSNVWNGNKTVLFLELAG